MKKILFVLAFAFIGQQAFSQIYIMTYSEVEGGHPSGCVLDCILTKINPTGNVTYTCLESWEITENPQTFVTINTEINQIINQGYKLIGTNFGGGGRTSSFSNNTGTTNYTYGSTQGSNITYYEEHNKHTTWYFAIPWSASGLEEVTKTLNSLSISPNPATDFVNISLSYDLKGESEIVFISEAGYIYHKESIDSISKNETYNIDISRIPAGKYLVTIKNKKTYTTPQKLIIL